MSQEQRERLETEVIQWKGLTILALVGGITFGVTQNAGLTLGALICTGLTLGVIYK